jgi:glucose/arabinose dehydrogenase
LPRSDPNALGEIYAYGFRNAHRISWDTDGTLFANDIGMNHIEEINIVRNGGNYGWMSAKGTGKRPLARRRAERALPAAAEVLDGRQKDGFTIRSRSTTTTKGGR